MKETITPISQGNRRGSRFQAIAGSVLLPLTILGIAKCSPAASAYADNYWPTSVGEAGAPNSAGIADAQPETQSNPQTCENGCTISEDGLNLILDFEGFSSKPYKDADRFSIGYGSTTINGESVTMETPPISESDARALAQEQINNHYGAAVNEAFAGVALNQNQYDALVSLTYNVGTKWLTDSKLLDLIKANPNDPAIGDAMEEYCHSEGKVLQALVNRRAGEKKVYFTPVITQQSKYAANNVEIFDQTDPRWKDAPFGTSTVGKSGCAPSALAMVINAMTDNHVTPDEVAAFAGDHGQYAPGQGAYWSIPDVVLPNWGLESENIDKNVDSVNQVLRDGGMVILSGKDNDPNIPFTKDGHYIVIRGYAVDSEGKMWWVIFDSAPGPDHNSFDIWDSDSIIGEVNELPSGETSMRAITVKK